MEYVFGPVPSRRLGNSLGVDLVTFKACTYDCVYCQLGRTTDQTTVRRRFVPPERVIAEIEQAVASNAAIDYITLSGSGEPTLSLDCGQVIRATKELTAIPVAVLTNGSLLGRTDVRDDLAEADVVVPSFDAGTQEAFERVNRPTGGGVEAVARGICGFTRAYGGAVWLEVMIVEGINDTVEEAEAIVAGLDGARLDRVDLSTVVRSPAESWARPVGRERLDKLAAVLERLAPVAVISGYQRKGHDSHREDIEQDILATLKRRPCGTRGLSASLGIHINLVVKHVEEMAREGTVERVAVGETMQYRLVRQ